MTAFIFRRWWLLRNRLFPTIAMVFALPSILSIVIVLGTKHIIIRSINGIPYEIWVVPGLMMLLSAIMITPLLYRDFFDLRIHKKALVPITLAPIRKSTIIMGIIFSAMTEVVVIIIFAQLIYNLIFPQSIDFISGFYNIMYTIIFVLLYSNVIISLSLLTERISLFLSALLILLIGIMFGCGFIIEFEFFPESMGTFLINIPISMLAIANRSIVFIHQFDIVNTLIPIAVIIMWIILNSILLKRKFKH